ncbi:MAG: radical SAM protein [Elusimicrobiota bacterium]
MEGCFRRRRDDPSRGGRAMTHPDERRGAAGFGEMRRIEVHLGTRCNNLCVFCMSSMNRDEKEDWARPEKVRAELRHFYGQGCRAAGFLGGEPTVYPHIVESIAYAREIGYERISICTNGTRLSDAQFCRGLVEAGLTRVTLSVHSHSPEIEDGLITGVPGNLERKMEALRNLVAMRRAGQLRDNVSLNPVLCRPTLKEMEKYIVFFGELGLDDIRFNYIWPQGAVRNDRAWTPSFREAMPEIVRILLLNERRLGRHLSFGGVPRCALALAGVSGRLADFLGAKYLDESLFDPANDVSMATKKGPMRDRFVWQDVKKNILKTAAPQCSRCRYEARCEGVWKTYADLYGLEELSPL